ILLFGASDYRRPFRRQMLALRRPVYHEGEDLMKFLTPVRVGLATLLVAGTMAFSAPTALAQPPGGGGFQMPPEMKAKIEALKKWGESHKKAFSLGDMIY